MAHSFIGVAGVSSQAEAQRTVELLKRNDLSAFSQKSHTGMLGFQVTYKSIRYGYSKGNRRVPRTDKLGAIMKSVALDAHMAIHYFTPTPETLVQEIDAALSIPETSRGNGHTISSQMLVDSLQINGVWPTTQQVSEIQNRYPHISIILQVSKNVTDGRTPVAVARKIQEDYPYGISYFILDPSMGKGLEFNMDQAVATYDAMQSIGVENDVVFAGGFTAENVFGRVRELRRRLGHKKFSIDAEGGLRDKRGEGYGNDVLNFGKLEGYLRGAAAAFE